MIADRAPAATVATVGDVPAVIEAATVATAAAVLKALPKSIWISS